MAERRYGGERYCGGDGYYGGDMYIPITIPIPN